MRNQKTILQSAALTRAQLALKAAAEALEEAKEPVLSMRAKGLAAVAELVQTTSGAANA